MKMKKIILFFAICCVVAGHAASAEDSGEIFIEQNGKHVEMDYVVGNSTTTGVFDPKVVIMADGDHAEMRIKEKTPVFYTKEHPSEISIVKFDTDTYKKKMMRYVSMQIVGQMGNAGDAEVQFTSKKEGDGFYKIILKKPLDKGEYGIITAHAQERVMNYAYHIYDFGVE